MGPRIITLKYLILSSEGDALIPGAGSLRRRWVSLMILRGRLLLAIGLNLQAYFLISLFFWFSILEFFCVVFICSGILGCFAELYHALKSCKPFYELDLHFPVCSLRFILMISGWYRSINLSKLNFWNTCSILHRKECNLKLFFIALLLSPAKSRLEWCLGLEKAKEKLQWCFRFYGFYSLRPQTKFVIYLESGLDDYGMETVGWKCKEVLLFQCLSSSLLRSNN